MTKKNTTKRKLVPFRLTDAEYKALTRLAKRNERSRNWIIGRLIAMADHATRLDDLADHVADLDIAERAQTAQE